jgi:peptide-methionine (S)-S-oxide reductase
MHRIQLWRTTWIAVILLFGVLSIARSQGAESSNVARATFAGGCFWCMEEAFEKVPGVTSATSGYIGGQVPQPSYEQVSAGKTGHAEAIEVVYDPARVSYSQLLEVFWRNIDPLTPNAQFCDHGTQYRAEIFYHNNEQKQLAEASREALTNSKRFKTPIVTQINMAATFYPAEEYHQDYYKKNPLRYKFYKYNCGRAQRLERHGTPGHGECCYAKMAGALSK